MKQQEEFERGTILQNSSLSPDQRSRISRRRLSQSAAKAAGLDGHFEIFLKDDVPPFKGRATNLNRGHRALP